MRRRRGLLEVFWMILCWDSRIVPGISAITTISTDPPNNPLATGFNNLIVTAQFPTPTRSFASCFWYYGGELDSGSGASFYNAVFGGCEPPAPGTYDSITCTEQTIDGTNHTITTLKITQPLVVGNLNIEVRCSIATTPGSITRAVKDCPSSLPYGVVITSSSQTYQVAGMFSCPTGDLFYSNGISVPSAHTSCSANTQWSGEENLRCGTAPSVDISGKLTTFEGGSVTLSCDYDQSIKPTGEHSIFYLNGTGYKTAKENIFKFTLHKEDDMKPISCQAVTPYTETYNNTGRSPTYILKALYEPYQKNSTLCVWNVDEAEECLVKFYSNDLLEYMSVHRDGLPAINDGFNNHLYSNENEYIYVYTKPQVSSSDQGDYTIIVNSSIPPYQHSVNFTILVNSDVAMPVGDILAAIFGVVIFLAIAVAVVCHMITSRGKQTKSPEQKPSVRQEAQPTSPIQAREIPEYVDFNRQAPSICANITARPKANQGPRYDASAGSTCSIYENVSTLKNESQQYVDMRVTKKQENVKSMYVPVM
ncbi:uncharacterized protein LOC143446023 isoform X2 [Clavelina lepadiformis]|uniref:uncharacterized protein LOC143446023 isoform X2 n=1 Tax=Clavelina lepadiformis TaxID=159417 RepID=UPI0040437EE9